MRSTILIAAPFLFAVTVMAQAASSFTPSLVDVRWQDRGVRVHDKATAQAKWTETCGPQAKGYYTTWEDNKDGRKAMAACDLLPPGGGQYRSLSKDVQSKLGWVKKAGEA